MGSGSEIEGAARSTIEALVLFYKNVKDLLLHRANNLFFFTEQVINDDEEERSLNINGLCSWSYCIT